MRTVWFLFAAFFLAGYALDSVRLRRTAVETRRRLHRAVFVLYGLGVSLCMSLGILSLIAGFDVFEAFWAGDSSSPFSILGLGVWALVVSLFGVYVYCWRGDADMAELHNCRRFAGFTITPRGVRLVVGVLYALLALITAVRVLL